MIKGDEKILLITAVGTVVVGLGLIFVIEGANQNFLIMAVGTVGVVGLGLFFRYIRLKRAWAYFRVVYAAREVLSGDALFAEFAPVGIDKEDLLLILEGGADYTQVPAGKFRPTDSFLKELCPPSLISPTQVTITNMLFMSMKRLRKKYPGLRASGARIETLGDYVSALARDVEKRRQVDLVRGK